ncbi:PrgI family protein [Candidatus Saccharibacteria bacterium]|nr:PrgI family protein [Candidatus Saccharibacteria bacterium]
MAQYKVPQDVEAEDKLLGPFTFRQFVYLIIAFVNIALAWAFFQLFPVLVIIPLPLIVLFAVLALPLRKDQPMETYLAAVVSFHLKANKRLWMPGQRDSAILITAPKQTDEPRTRDLTEEEAGHRLSFLADIVDTEGYSIKNAGSSSLREEYVAEANATPDILENPAYNVIGQMIAEEQADRHTELVNQMRAAIERTEAANAEASQAATSSFGTNIAPLSAQAPATEGAESAAPAVTPSDVIVTPEPFEPPATPAAPAPAPRPDMVNLANNSDYSVETIQKEANRLKNKREDEVYISLH